MNLSREFSLFEMASVIRFSLLSLLLETEILSALSFASSVIGKLT